MNQLLLEYMRTHEISDEMNWKSSAIKQMVFVRDTLCDYLLRVPVFVVSTHRSKSIELPVYYFEMRNGIRAIMRENFHGWIVTLITSHPVTLEDFCHGHGIYPYEDIPKCYAEGFKDSWLHPYVKEGARRTTFEVDGDYKLYTLFYLLDKTGSTRLRDSDVIKDEKFVSQLMNTMIENHPNMYPHELFVCSLYKSGSNTFCKEHGLKIHISSDEIVSEISRRVELWDELADEFYMEMGLLYDGERFE